jgi:hypothetical protein
MAVSHGISCTVTDGEFTNLVDHFILQRPLVTVA